ncbi:MAG: hypothetical protein HYU66_17105, partial [Armatimonadetes bacterium]|nr:hypothetical protein [Armatimonadota bacterium]
ALAVVPPGGAESAPAERTLALQVTRKPGIGLVWLGTLAALAGGILCLGRERDGAAA